MCGSSYGFDYLMTQNHLVGQDNAEEGYLVGDISGDTQKQSPTSTAPIFTGCRPSSDSFPFYIVEAESNYELEVSVSRLREQGKDWGWGICTDPCPDP